MNYKVKVKNIPVRYDHRTYQPDEEFIIKGEHIKGTESIVDIVEEIEVKPKSVDQMLVDELKEYAADNEIDLGKATKKDDILAVIKGDPEIDNDDPGDDE